MAQATLPHGPRSALPQIFRFRSPFASLEAMATRYGDPFTVPVLGGGPMVVTWDPEGIRAIFSADPDAFAPGASEALALILGQGSIFLMSGLRHRRARKLLMPPFHGDRMRAYGEVVRAAALRWLGRWPVGARAEALTTTQGITLDVIIEALFGVQDGARVESFHREILATVEAFSPLFAVRFMQREFGGLGPWARFQRRTRALHATMRALIEEKRARPGADILSLLLAVRDEDGDALAESEIFDQLLSFIVAGHETTATSLAWALDDLHRHPAALARLRDALAGLGDAPTPEALAACPLLEAACQETLRLHPPVPLVPRKLTRELAFKGFALPAGVSLAACPYLAHRRPETFADPLAYRPERFLERTFSPFEWLPFGGGSRRCLGAAFAMYEMKIALATLLQSAELRLEEPRPVRSVFRIATFGPETGIRMTLLRRR